MPDGKIAPANPSATIVLLRDADRGLEVLLVRRSKRLTFHGGAWVFPGGRIDPEDYPAGDTSDLFAAAQQAAVRELKEEAGLDATIANLRPVSRWITPIFLPKRFDTWFFLAQAESHDVVVDGGEIREFRWTTPAEALNERRVGAIELPPPTFVTLTLLAEHKSSDAALSQVPRSPVRQYTPKICTIEGGACSLYEGDAGYEEGNPDLPGQRHRLWLLDTDWRYEDGVS